MTGRWTMRVTTPHGEVVLASDESAAEAARGSGAVALSVDVLDAINRVFSGAKLESIRKLGTTKGGSTAT